MTFYEALKYLLNTAGGRISRKSWRGNYYLCKHFYSGSSTVDIVLESRSGKYKEIYSASSVDMTANDWCIEKE